MKFYCLISLTLLLGYTAFGWSQLSESSIGNQQNGFIENKGQIADREGKQRADVLFQVAHQNTFLRKTGISYVFSDQNEVWSKINIAIQQSLNPDSILFELNEMKAQSELWQQSKIRVHQVDMNFLNANKHSTVHKTERSVGYSNFYYSHCADGVLNVHEYQKVNYHHIYDGIDLAFSQPTADGLKYDFIVRPFADPSQIQLEWIGADSVYLSAKGELIVENQISSIHESIPKVYQIIQNDTVLIMTKYHLESGDGKSTIVSFDIDDYDPNFKLIIDPWVTNYGGEDIDYGLEVDTDFEGNVVMSGETYSTTAISEAGFQMVLGGGLSDSFLAKFNENGVRLWGTYYGGAGGMRERGNGVATDSDGNIYVGGATATTGAIATVGSYQPDFGGGLFDGYIAKFDPSGARLWGTYFGGVGEDYAMNIGVDIFDNSYIVGYTFSESGIAFDGHQMDLGGFADGFLVKFDPDGNREWATYYGGTNAELFHDIEGDKFGNIVLSGVTTSAEQIASVGAFQEDFAGGQDAFLVKFDPSGTRLWGTYYGQLWVERGDAVTTDTSGNVYMAGKTTAPTGSATPGAFQTTSGGISDGFLTKYNPEGDQLWATYVGGESIDYAFAVDVDEISNNVIIAGQTESEDFPTATCAAQNELVGDMNAFVTQFLPDGELFCSSYLGVLHEEENVLTVKDCWIYIAGSTKGIMATPGVHQTTYGGGEFDAFLGRVHLASCELTIPDLLTTIETESTDVTSCTPCNGSATVDITDFCMNPSALKTYRWSNGVEEWYTTETISTIDGICEGDYWVEVTINCDQRDTFYFEIDNTASITAEFSMTDVCAGEAVSFNNTSFTIFGDIIAHDWDFDDGNFSTDENPVHVYDEPGEYEVELTVENDSECLDSLILLLQVYPNYEIVIDTAICEGEIFELPDGSSITVNSDTNWEGAFTSVHGCDSSITINVEMALSFFESENVYVNEGEVYVYPDGTTELILINTTHSSFLQTTAFCDSTILTNVFVIEEPEMPVNTSFTAPNIFTPDNDGTNNLFYFPSEGVETFNCVITNRWGIEIFQFNSIDDVWDGADMKTGNECADGVYFYTYSGEFNSGELFQGHGNVQLLRGE